MNRLLNFRDVKSVIALSRQTLNKFTSNIRPVRVIPARNLVIESAPRSPTAETAKDIIVYKYENPRFFKMMNFFTISQLFFWGYLAHWTFYGLKDAKVSEEQSKDEDVSWWRKLNLGENKYRNAFATLCLFIGEYHPPFNPTRFTTSFIHLQATQSSSSVGPSP
jgi:hypothetical protein